MSFVENGLTSVEVIDDGTGIAPDDMSLIGRRHYTSKITSDKEVYEVQTYGFRGEALHSLAALSEELCVTSLHCENTSGIGARLTVNNGRETVSKVACPKGTSVRLAGLLCGLPVRLAEWRRNAKRHFSRALWLIQSYALAVPSVRIRCTNTTGKSAQTLFASSGSNDVSRTFAETFSGELEGNFQRIEVSEDRFQADFFFYPAARRAADRQFIFLNERPCDIPKVLRKINEVFRAHSVDGYPIGVLYITTDESVDTNLTPDKRQVLFAFEQELIDSLVQALSNCLTETSRLAEKLPPTLKSSSQPIPSSQSIPSSQFLPTSPRREIPTGASHCCSDVPSVRTLMEMPVEG